MRTYTETQIIVSKKVLSIVKIVYNWEQRYLFSDLPDDAEFEVSGNDVLTEVCAGGLLNKKLLINLQMARNG